MVVVPRLAGRLIGLPDTEICDKRSRSRPRCGVTTTLHLPEQAIGRTDARSDQRHVVWSCATGSYRLRQSSPGFPVALLATE